MPFLPLSRVYGWVLAVPARMEGERKWLLGVAACRMACAQRAWTVARRRLPFLPENGNRWPGVAGVWRTPRRRVLA